MVGSLSAATVWPLAAFMPLLRLCTGRLARLYSLQRFRMMTACPRSYEKFWDLWFGRDSIAIRSQRICRHGGVGTWDLLSSV